MPCWKSSARHPSAFVRDIGKIILEAECINSFFFTFRIILEEVPRIRAQSGRIYCILETLGKGGYGTVHKAIICGDSSPSSSDSMGRQGIHDGKAGNFELGEIPLPPTGRNHL